MMAAWYLDDGSLSGTYAQIATNSFKKEDVEWMIKYLNSRKLTCYLYEGQPSDKRNYGFRIFFTQNGTHNLFKLIKEYVPPTMQYKLFDEYKNLFNEDHWTKKQKTLPYFNDSVVTSAPENKVKSLRAWVYCLEVESKHSNFCTSSLVVHNCFQNCKEWGFKFHMNDVNSAVGIENLKHVPRLLDAHRDNAEFYDWELRNVDGLTLLDRHLDYESSYWIYSMLVEDRDSFNKLMKECGIAVSMVHDRVDKHDCFSESKAFLPNLDRTIGKLTNIPVHHAVTLEQRQYIADCIKGGW